MCELLQLDLFSGSSVTSCTGQPDQVVNIDKKEHLFHARDPTDQKPEKDRVSSLNENQKKLADSLRRKSRELVLNSIKKKLQTPPQE